MFDTPPKPFRYTIAYRSNETDEPNHRIVVKTDDLAAVRAAAGSATPAEMRAAILQRLQQIAPALALGELDPDLKGFFWAIDVLRVTREKPLKAPPEEKAGRDRLAAVKAAIGVLAADLPDLIRGAGQTLASSRRDKEKPWLAEAEIDILRALYADAVSAGASVFLSARLPNSEAQWHRVALLMRWHLRAIWRGRQAKIPSFRVDDSGCSPALAFVAWLLGEVGQGIHEPAAVMQAFKRAEDGRPLTPATFPRGFEIVG